MCIVHMIFLKRKSVHAVTIQGEREILSVRLYSGMCVSERCLLSPEEGTESSGAGVTGGFEPWCWELNLGSSVRTLITAEPSLSPSFKTKVYIMHSLLYPQLPYGQNVIG